MTSSNVAPRRLIGVIGGSSGSDAVLEAARQVGYELGRRGVSLVCGGLGGVMEAACRGLRLGRESADSEALAIGLLPGESAADANPWVDIAIPTGMGIARNLLIVRSAAAVIAIDGGSGTLSEMAFAWQLGRPIVALTSTRGVSAEYAGKRIDDRRDDVIEGAETAEGAVLQVLDRLTSKNRATLRPKPR